ncbi:MAG: TolC family protein, partial [Cyclobacteriaceae bacterium]
YWQWVATLRSAEVIRQGLSLAEERFLAVKQAVINGDKAAIDTVESLILVQKLRNDLSKQLMDSLNQTLSINNLLWNVAEGTVFIPNSITSFDLADLSTYEDFAIRAHPELRGIQNKGEQLDNDRKYYAEQIKPELDVNYNFLLQEGNPDNQNFAINNYKAGVSFSVPLFLRKERSKLQMSKIKISENDLKMDQKSREIINKVRMAYNQTVVTNDLVNQQRQVVNNYVRMLEGEQQKFNNGESSIFLLNSRQNKLLEAQLKLIDLEISYRIYLAKLLWQSGYFPNLVK